MRCPTGRLPQGAIDPLCLRQKMTARRTKALSWPGMKRKEQGLMHARATLQRGAGAAGMAPTDITNPKYFHKVVDCQWACPTHTPVPEYIRLIAQGRYAAAYMLNWESNVFPGILGRVCDRPCEPACRRGRVQIGDEANAKDPTPEECRAGRHLPPEARRRRLQGRDRRLHAGRSPARRTASASRCSAPARPRSRSRAICCRSATRARCSRRTPRAAA